ncbi:MAG: hypothetical protein ABEJ89_06040 [Haloarculaceae archaeon]
MHPLFDRVPTAHPRLAAVVVVGAVVLVAGLAVNRFSDPVLGIRLFFLGGMAVVFGAAGFIALSIQRRIDATER